MKKRIFATILLVFMAIMLFVPQTTGIVKATNNANDLDDNELSYYFTAYFTEHNEYSTQEALNLITEIDLSNSGITTLKGLETMVLNNLKYLNLSDNKISEIDKSLFTCFPALEVIDLSGNKLTRVKLDGTYKSVDLSGNKLDYVELNSENLEFVDISNNKFATESRIVIEYSNPVIIGYGNQIISNNITNTNLFLGLQNLTSASMLSGSNMYVYDFYEPGYGVKLTDATYENQIQLLRNNPEVANCVSRQMQSGRYGIVFVDETGEEIVNNTGFELVQNGNYDGTGVYFRRIDGHIVNITTTLENGDDLTGLYTINGTFFTINGHCYSLADKYSRFIATVRPNNGTIFLRTADDEDTFYLTEGTFRSGTEFVIYSTLEKDTEVSYKYMINGEPINYSKGNTFTLVDRGAYVLTCMVIENGVESDTISFNIIIYEVRALGFWEWLSIGVAGVGLIYLIFYMAKKKSDVITTDANNDFEW